MITHNKLCVNLRIIAEMSDYLFQLSLDLKFSYYLFSFTDNYTQNTKMYDMMNLALLTSLCAETHEIKD